MKLENLELRARKELFVCRYSIARISLEQRPRDRFVANLLFESDKVGRLCSGFCMYTYRDEIG